MLKGSLTLSQPYQRGELCLPMFRSFWLMFRWSGEEVILRQVGSTMIESAFIYWALAFHKDHRRPDAHNIP